MVHMGANKIVPPSHQGPFHGKEYPGGNMFRIGQGVHNLTYLTVYRE